MSKNENNKFGHATISYRVDEGVDSWVEAHGNRRQWTLEDLVKVLQGTTDPEEYDPVPHVARAILRGGISSTELGV